MGPGEASEYRAASARLNYLALDRPDILFASKECSRRMSSPRNGDWVALKRVVRYLLGKPRLVWRFGWQEKPKFLSAFSDSNWAGCHDTRKSTSVSALLEPPPRVRLKKAHVYVLYGPRMIFVNEDNQISADIRGLVFEKTARISRKGNIMLNL